MRAAETELEADARAAGGWARRRSHSPAAIRTRPRMPPSATRVAGVSQSRSIACLTRKVPASAMVPAPSQTSQRAVMSSSSRFLGVGGGAFATSSPSCATVAAISGSGAADVATAAAGAMPRSGTAAACEAEKRDLSRASISCRSAWTSRLSRPVRTSATIASTGTTKTLNKPNRMARANTCEAPTRRVQGCRRAGAPFLGRGIGPPRDRRWAVYIDMPTQR